MANSNNIYNIPFSSSFWDTLANRYIDKYKKDELSLAKTLFLLPNRRACKNLTNAFIKTQGLKPTILPQIVPIGEIDDDEIFFNNLDFSELLIENKRTITKEERLFLFARLIMSKPTDFGLKQISLAQAINLAIDLANIIDTVNNQGLSFDKLNDLVPDKYATHWQETLKLLKIITMYWPEILKEKNCIDLLEHKNNLLFEQARIWKSTRTKQNIVIAGITTNFPSIVEIFNTIKYLENGEIYFAGIDFIADDEYWSAIDENHPQFELKSLLELLNIKRENIYNLTSNEASQKEIFISEIMRPAIVSNEWRNLNNKLNINLATNGIETLTANTQNDEALAIALKIRQILEIPEKTVAFVTYDRGLSRRVCSQLKRFEINADDSAGIPLSLTPIGIFFRSILEAGLNIDSNLKLITLLKNPFLLARESAKDIRESTYNYELAIRKNKKDSQEAESITQIKSKLNELNTLLNSNNITLENILKHHIKLAEEFATSNEQEGKNILWKGENGKSFVKFITKVLESSNSLGNINGEDYLALITELMSLESVRSNYGTHPRLSILGPIEARLCNFDYIILGELNEGIWPKPLDADMWMSRPMKKDFGFNLPEKVIGILGLDLCCFLSSKNVLMTRALRVGATPMKKSRWLLRIETVLQALNFNIEELQLDKLMDFTNKLDKPVQYNPIKAPAPCPPVDSRPRRLSASALDLLTKDPYSVFAKYILKLYSLDDIDAEPDQRHYGTLIHAIIEEFNNLYPQNIPSNSLDILIELGKKHFTLANITKDIKAFWWPKFEKTAKWIVENEINYRYQVQKIHNEIKGEIKYNLPQGEFCFNAIADRIDELKDGYINIFDYKTGNIPSEKEILSGHALQVALEGIILQKNGFSGIKSNKLNKLSYWKLGEKTLDINDQITDLLKNTEEYIVKLATTFDFITTPYLVKPHSKYVSKNKDYEHLSRIKEWSVVDEDDSNDE